jgi:hypothetical protein
MGKLLELQKGVSLPPDIEADLNRVARRKQIGPQQLAALWIAERLGV